MVNIFKDYAEYLFATSFASVPLLVPSIRVWTDQHSCSITAGVHV